MPASISNTTTGNWSSAASTQTISVVRAAGEALIIGFYYERDFGSIDTISSVVWDAAGDNQTMTLLENQQSAGNTRWLALYALATPTSVKTADITINFSGANNNRGMIIVRHVTGHDTGAMIRGNDSIGLTDTTPSELTLASASGDLAIGWMFHRDSAAAVSPNGSPGDVVENQHPSADRVLASASLAGAATVTFSYANSGSFDTAMVAASIQAAAVSGSVLTRQRGMSGGMAELTGGMRG